MTTPLLYTLVIAPTEMGNEIELLRFPTRYAPSAGAYAHWVLSQAFEEGEDGYEDYIRQIFDFETATYDRETCTLRGITPDGHTDAFSANDAAGIMRRGSWWHKSYDHGIAWRTLHVDGRDTSRASRNRGAVPNEYHKLGCCWSGGKR